MHPKRRQWRLHESYLSFMPELTCTIIIIMKFLYLNNQKQITDSEIFIFKEPKANKG
jgi:hypothetical protein